MTAPKSINTPKRPYTLCIGNTPLHLTQAEASTLIDEITYQMTDETKLAVAIPMNTNGVLIMTIDDAQQTAEHLLTDHCHTVPEAIYVPDIQQCVDDLADATPGKPPKPEPKTYRIIGSLTRP